MKAFQPNDVLGIFQDERLMTKVIATVVHITVRLKR